MLLIAITIITIITTAIIAVTPIIITTIITMVLWSASRVSAGSWLAGGKLQEAPCLALARAARNRLR